MTINCSKMSCFCQLFKLLVYIIICGICFTLTGGFVDTSSFLVLIFFINRVCVSVYFYFILVPSKDLFLSIS